MRFTKKNTLVEQEKEKYINAAPLEEKKKVRNISVILNSIENETLEKNLIGIICINGNRNNCGCIIHNIYF